ncbi:MAG TPA: type II secretion system protein GspM [Dongiaceae bacterium]|nr:type II secretion system protein GspM [Dongiaceae bacterium]
MRRAILKPLKRPRLPSAPRLTARQWASRLGAMLLLLGVILLAKEGVIDPILDSVNQSREEIADAATRLSRIKAIAATKPELEAQAAKMMSDIGQSDAFMRADTEALAGAALQERLRTLTSAQGISLGAIQWAAGKTDSGLGRISVRVQITATLGPLYALLGSVESTMPLLFIDDIDIQATAGGDPGQPVQDGPLSVTFDCYGYWLGPENAPAKP